MSDSRGGWELTKENIQPLSCGRRMADLAEALPNRTATCLSDQQQYEASHLKEIEKLEQEAKQKLGDDPLQPWVNVIRYFQQHFPNMAHNIKIKYSKVLSEAMNEFYGDLNYSNDDRYIKIVITAMKAYPPCSQIKKLCDIMHDGVGEYSDEMYLRLAELYDGEGDTKKASDIIKEGMEKVVGSTDRLQEMLTHIQESWAKSYAKRLQSCDSKQEEEDFEASARRFATSVPTVGERNEAISIRQNLQAAGPTNTRPTLDARQNGLPKKLSVFDEENTAPQSRSFKDNHSHQSSGLKRLESLNSEDSDRENKLEPCRWNLKHTELENPAIPEPPAKLKLFVEETLPCTSSAASKTQNLNNRALKERKESELPEVESLPTIQPPAPIVNSGDTNVGDLSVTKDSGSVANQTTKKEMKVEVKIFNWKKDNYESLKDNFWDTESIKYKPLPVGRKGNYKLMKVEQWLAERDRLVKIKKAENNELVQKQNQILQLTDMIETLRKENEHLKTLADSVPKLEEKLEDQATQSKQKLLECEEKMFNLEAQNEDLMNKLTKMTTTNNVRDSQFHRLENEKARLEQELDDLKRQLDQEKQQHQEEIQFYKRKLNDLVNQESIIAKRIKQEKLDEEDEYEKQRSTFGKKQSFVDVDVRSRTVEIYSSPSTSTDQGTGTDTDEASRFQSGDTTVEQQQSVVGSSFMPELGDDKSMMMSMEMPRQALGMVERPLRGDMMNMTPVAPPSMDFDIPPPSFGGGLFKRPTQRAFSLYESISDSMSKPTKPNTSNAGSKRVDLVKNLQVLPENQPPPPAQQVFPTINSDENAPSGFFERRADIIRTEDHFRRPAIPSDENAIPALPKPRRSIILQQHRRQDDSSDEEEEERILRRHQQTGVDLNISNLTVALSMGPKPLINSTPERERERTIRLPPTAPRNLAQEDVEEQPTNDCHTNRASRFSILNEPPLNLSTIQETSRENRSRSTTGSSSGNTMSSTRFGAASTSTHLGSNTTGRSASVPRSASRISQHGNYNGYHSDTNGFQ